MSVPIIGGQVKVTCPCGRESTYKVKQVKGQGVHDAIKLKGTKPNPLHLAIIAAMVEQPALSSTDIRLRAKTMLYTSNNELHKKFSSQNNHIRPFSELIWWKVVVKVAETKFAPLYRIDYVMADHITHHGFGKL